MKKVRRFLSRLLPILIISLVLGYSGYSWNAKVIGGNAMPMPFGVGMSVVLSGSMEPVLSVDDLVIIRAAESYEPGDIIVYQWGSSLVIHRLLETDGVTAITKGDANNTADEPIPTYLIKGKLVKTVPGLGAAVEFLQSTPGTLLILAAAVFFLVRSRRSEEAAAAAELDKIRRQIEQLKAEMEDLPESSADTEETEEQRETR